MADNIWFNVVLEAGMQIQNSKQQSLSEFGNNLSNVFANITYKNINRTQNQENEKPVIENRIKIYLKLVSILQLNQITRDSDEMIKLSELKDKIVSEQINSPNFFTKEEITIYENILKEIDKDIKSISERRQEIRSYLEIKAIKEEREGKWPAAQKTREKIAKLELFRSEDNFKTIKDLDYALCLSVLTGMQRGNPQ
jgi:hypothetical protein